MQYKRDQAPVILKVSPARSGWGGRWRLRMRRQISAGERGRLDPRLPRRQGIWRRSVFRYLRLIAAFLVDPVFIRDLQRSELLAAVAGGSGPA
jgi:hypothetical protein